VVTGDADSVPACVRVLGPLELVGSEGMAPLGGAKERRLLAVLAVHSGEVVADDRLVDVLWDGSPPRTASKTLQNYVLRLRRALRGCAGYAIVTRPPGYRLDGGTDAMYAESLIAKARRAAEVAEYPAAISMFDRALGLWRGRSIDAVQLAEQTCADSAAGGRIGVAACGCLGGDGVVVRCEPGLTSRVHLLTVPGSCCSARAGAGAGTLRDATWFQVGRTASAKESVRDEAPDDDH